MTRSLALPLAALGCGALVWVLGILLAWPERGQSSEPPAARPVARSLGEARAQAEVLHASLHATLQIVHRRYYREDEGLPIPAAVVREVFRELEDEQNIQLRWLAVEGQVMNVDHKPRDAFEREAAQAIKAGQASFERVEGGTYRRAAPIVLTNHCLKCHLPDRKSTEDRKAGLLVSIPLAETR